MEWKIERSQEIKLFLYENLQMLPMQMGGICTEGLPTFNYILPKMLSNQGWQPFYDNLKSTLQYFYRFCS